MIIVFVAFLFLTHIQKIFQKIFLHFFICRSNGRSGDKFYGKFSGCGKRKATDTIIIVKKSKYTAAGKGCEEKISCC